MQGLSDTIEQFIKALMDEGNSSQIEVRRNELAQYFNCAPSQINYVLATRFTLDRGYHIESRRGGGGYIRIVRVLKDSTDYLMYLISERLSSAIDEEGAVGILQGLLEAGLRTHREAVLLTSMVKDKALGIPAPIRDQVRAIQLRAALTQLMVLPKEE